MQKLLLHTCCAPCLTASEEKIRSDFKITTFWFNPNIEPNEEHNLRLSTYKSYCAKKNLQMLINETDHSENITNWREYLEADLPHDPSSYIEGKERCESCIFFRLRETAKTAKKKGFDSFSTTLSVSPHKNFLFINTIGEQLSKQYMINFLSIDFKKQNGYARSVELSRKNNLYRQNYCGCEFSKANTQK